MKRKNLWIAPIAVVALFVVEMFLYYIMIFGEYLLLDGKWGGNAIDTFVSIFNVVFFIAFSVLVYALVMPKLFKKFNVDFKQSAMIIFAFFILISVIQCFMYIYVGNTDFYYFVSMLSEFYLAFTYNFPEEYIPAACILIFILNLIKPVCFLVSSKRLSKKQ